MAINMAINMVKALPEEHKLRHVEEQPPAQRGGRLSRRPL